ncbi:chitin deacetylase [Lobosporangium transversale]|uniref:NodB homology domain-containing protein n=1 Tax=Lobosporangium transversale TaxID=64571 RepID=A0A1Y2GFV2_9FUNG|nr:hypothetical protein BCR41DRAFT_358984 [Lobosporangium transversale]KAF9907781.1 chitin deacetylase [Lobosporangium transversale]ORZ08769.1 hypothetical protein BCR41DRAFT_358984 [Lobosporangium transversale]|eukprot:XP_021878552.1 hypothetical protein BCR41DRAFT_358984 [Lobosporangium transversale]
MKAVFSTVAFAILATAATAQFNPTDFPPVNEVPPIDSPQMKQWLKDISFADVPTFPTHTGNPPICPTIDKIPADQCWWTCQTCPADDIESCPTPGTWGLTFDDGPTPETPPLLDFLKTNNIKASFFVMGSNVVRNAEVLRREVAEGHHIASHTWSHHALTTLSNQQIVAELKWTEKAVFDITGLRMKYMRPPYGDIDNRVRAIVKKLGYIVVDWTSDDYDSRDVALNANPSGLDAALRRMTNNLMTYGANPGAKGIITLEHDLYPVTIKFAQAIVPVGAQAKLKVTSVADCLGDANPYQNSVNLPTNTTKTHGSPSGTGKPSGPSVLPPGGGANALTMNSGVLMAIVAIAGTVLAAF